MIFSTDFVARVLKVFEQYDQYDDLYWRTGPMYGGGEFNKPASFFVNVNDVFCWGCADLEEITPENISALERAMADCEAAHKVLGSIHGAALFVARVRGMRPQGATYPQEPELWSLFDQCGPERETGCGNPHPHPSKKNLFEKPRL